MKKMEEYIIILYYKYTKITNLKYFQNKHLKFCQNLKLLGRIIISHEGINGTLCGKIENINQYIEIMKKNKIFNGIDFKITKYKENVFNKLSIKIKKEIVNLKLDKDIDMSKIKSNYLNPKEFHENLKNTDNIIIDVRNDYEFQLGHFKNAINPKIKNFRDLPMWVEKNKNLLKNKKIITYCTGGIRCEKFSAFLKSKGFSKTYQLKGGIITYGNKNFTKEILWNGKLYVFDNRIAIKINDQKYQIVGKDNFDNKPCERYINCANPICNKQFFCNKENEHKFWGSCCYKCKISKNNRYVMKNKNIKNNLSN
ncbi:oxygen-dependent tRNA uridine(34) hydroxylase TrhO [Candidatus Phytoplasma pyri]|uniref:oxygen-dependent tRNA uridine(34) hydroxylase TrhO n=1 Tax=Candidatus Phytoplasma pyri TaxID=47566 RepID=UPI003982F1CB